MKKVAKKLIFLSLMIALVGALTACGFLQGIVSPRQESGQQGSGQQSGYRVVVSDGGGLSAGDFVSGSRLVEPVTQPHKEGYDFAGWFLDADRTNPVRFNVTITSDVHIYGKWTARTPVATFVFGGGLESVRSEAVNGKFVPPTEPSRPGYTFVKWYADSSLTIEADFEAAAVSDATFYADWQVIAYVIIYDFDGLGVAGAGSVNRYTVEDRVTLVEPDDIPAGYEFLYWRDAEGNAVYEIARGSIGDRGYKAIYRSSNNAIVSVAGGKVDGLNVVIGMRYATDTVDFDEALTISDRATLAVFDSESVPVTAPVVMAVGTKVFRAEVTSESGVKATYTVTVTRYDENDSVITFRYPDGTSTNVGVPNGECVEQPEAKNIVAKDFVAWYREEGYVHLYDFADVVSADLDLYAKYVWTEYDIVYHYGIGSAPDGAPATYTAENGAALKNAVAPGGYAFAGYTDENGVDVASIPAGAYGDVVLYAHYVKTGSSFMTAAYAKEGQHLTKDQLVDYFSWAIANRYTSVSFIMDDACSQTYLVGEGEQKTNSVLSKVKVLVSSVQAGYSYHLDGSNNVQDATVTFTYVEPEGPSTNENYYTQLGYNVHPAFVKTRADDYNEFAIDFIDTAVTVTNSDQLVYAAMMGYRPLPTADSVAEETYDAARTVLRQIVDDTMTDVEKAHAIYHWLLKNVVYDYVLFTNPNHYTVAQLKTYNGFYLEGVFTDHRAVCDGISKAYALMCNIEGIPCVQVSGDMVESGGGHAWNKVKLGGKWYIVDATHGDTHIARNEVVNHEYFMMTDEQRAVTATPSDYVELVANTEYDVYEHLTFTVEEENYDMVIESRDELAALITYFAALCASKAETQTIDVRMDYAYDDISTELSNANGDFDFTHYGLSYSGGAARGDNLILIATKK